MIRDTIPFNLEFYPTTPDDFISPFDLSVPPLFRMAWIGGDGGEDILLIDVHHIITDGTSLDLLRKDFNDLCAGKKLPPIPISYKDFAEWQQHRAADPQGLMFWRTHLAGSSFELQMPYDSREWSDLGFRKSGIHSITLDATRSAALERLTHETATTPFTILLALYHLCLSKLTGQYDIVTGVVVAGRAQWQFQNVVGLFTNTLPIRSQWIQDQHFAEWISGFRDYILQALDYQDEDIETLAGQLLEEGYLAYHGGYSAMFTLNFDGSTEDASQHGAEARLTPIASSPAQTICDLVLTASARQNAYEFAFQYDAGRFSVTTIRRIADHFVRIIDQLTENASCAYKDIQIQHSLLQADTSKAIGLLSEISW
jgi:iturin family lipopeptide synthetase B